MTTKEILLRLLEEHRGTHVSGAKLAERIGVSRNAVWKAVEALRSEGYTIEAVINKGYALTQENDPLSPESIARLLPANAPFNISVRKSIDSTNSEARRRAIAGAAEGTVVVAEEQTQGRGRRGKRFYSPAGTGIYFSIVLRPHIAVDKATYITAAAAVAAARAIEQVTQVPASIKWVNDIFCDGKKVAGILTEGFFDMETGTLDHAILGIGINIRNPYGGFPDDLASTAGAITEEAVGGLRSELVAAFLREFWDLYLHLEERAYHAEYRERCFLIGQMVNIAHEGVRRRARAVDLTDEFRLVVEFPDKSRIELPYGEVSTRADAE